MNAGFPRHPGAPARSANEGSTMRYSKYGNELEICGLHHAHASKLESAVCSLIQLREKAGELKLIQTQFHVYLSKARIEYIPDFFCHDSQGKDLFIEAKGYAAPTWPIKKRLWKAYGLAPLEIWGGNYRNPQLLEIVYPET